MSVFLNIDIRLFEWFNSWVGLSPFFDWAIVFRAKYLIFVTILAVALFPLIAFLPRYTSFRRRNTDFFIFAMVASLMARFVVTEAIRFLYNRPRPFEALEGVRQLLEHAAGNSFPSGHAAFMFSLAAAVYFYYPKTSMLFFAAALFVGLSRVVAGVHWPSDIFGGAIVGIFTLFILRRHMMT